MRYRHLEVFFAIMHAGSVSAAAKRLRVSQPSITKTLRETEDALGYALFDRVKGRLQPTEEARALFKEAARAAAALDDVRQLSVRLKHGVAGILRVASTPSLGHEILPDAVEAQVRAHPNIRIEVSTQHSGDLLAALGKPGHGFDLGFTFGVEGGPPGIEAIELGRAALACVAAEGAFPKALRVVRVEDLAGRAIIGLDETEPVGRALAERADGLEIRLTAQVRAQTHRLACDLALRGLGVAIVDCYTAASFLHDHRRNPDGAAAQVLPFEPRMTLPVTAVYALSHGAPLAARQFLEHFRSALERADVQARGAGLVVR